ncbi:glycosyltransferase family A protein [Pseudodesulfovibrio sp.]|uniref:glycosyltransferase family A protein n=1 Tax=Pseudodesulfovibrio sp. TaxID=2035812 RepID=UPI002622A1DC|nr:glycosyltransferase family A protein [Pseudodesulfovibrio sp.]MDD3311021.1 glycosyltransferase family A protein [Pseudodesulfovibrio sp.]
MNPKYLEITQKGMSAQLAELTLDEMVSYVRNYLHAFLLDDRVCAALIQRLGSDQQVHAHPAAARCLRYLLDKAIKMRPFRPGVLDAAAKLAPTPEVMERLEIINALNAAKETFDLIIGLNLSEHADDVRQFLAHLIHAHPSHVAAAQYALYVDKGLGLPPGPWLKDFKCPRRLQPLWRASLFDHHARLCDWESAMALWPTLDADRLDEVALALAGDMFAALGDAGQALALYDKSIALDPVQTPVRLRRRELASPFPVTPSLVAERKVAILLYSWNKAEVLGRTLVSLSESDIGPADIHVLLNGCTDGSREVVESLRPRFPHNALTVHALHVNIGAPAARNWLMNLPEVRATDYIAFLDDDVLVQKDWLARFLTVAESDPKVAVVGAKIITPGAPPRLQYLYRHVAIADHELLKMSLHAPLDTYDTGIYDVVRETRNVMGCQHLLRTSALDAAPAGFDIRFSPSQVDDIEHDLALCLAGHKVMYCGTVTCEHLQQSGVTLDSHAFNPSQVGNAVANDMKLYYKYFFDLPKLKKLDCLGMDVGFEPAGI